MPISTSSFGDKRDNIYDQYEKGEGYEREVMEFPGLDVPMAEALFKKLGGGVSEKHRIMEGIGWTAILDATDDGTRVTFDAHDELLDDLIRRFEEMVDKALG